MTTLSSSIPRPTEAELELLRVLWDKEPATVREICDELNRERAFGYTTVLKLLQIMHAKGLVLREESNRAHLYRSAISQDAMQSRFLRDLSVRLFSGSAAQLALHALAMEPSSQAELDELRALLQSKAAGVATSPSALAGSAASGSAISRPASSGPASSRPASSRKDQQ